MITTGKKKVIYDEEFENIYIDITIKQFNELGFDFGDSVNIYFSDGHTELNIPYYSGYYSPVEHLQLTGYPGDPYIKIARNCGNPTWDEFGMNDDTTVEIVLDEKAKYLDIQELFSLKYSDDRDDFASDEMFVNFRALKGGNIKENYFYRSTSPCDNLHNRASYTDKILKAHDIKYVINLSNNAKRYEAFLEKEDFNSPYYHSLYCDNNVSLWLLNVNYRSQEFKKKVADGLLEMSKHEGPVVIHCAEGKDRTGFVCALILGLVGANAQEIVDDYMITYDNYYHITKQSSPKRYEAISNNIHDFIHSVCDKQTDIDFYDLDIYRGCKDYLKQGGLNDEEISEIENYIKK